jgi:nicotinamidase-related amidase
VRDRPRRSAADLGDGVVLSTVRQAADLDFGLTVLADGCGRHDRGRLGSGALTVDIVEPS